MLDQEKLDFIKANGKVFQLKVGEVIRLDLETDHYYWLDGEYVPQVTHILDQAGPVGYGLREFWKENTREESEEKLKTAQEFGTKMHDACEKLLSGLELNLLIDYSTAREKKVLMAFQNWFLAWKPTNIETEQTVALKKEIKAAGTLDLRALILDEDFIVDFKTSKSHQVKDEWQVRAYKQAYLESFGIEVKNCGVLRLGTTHKGNGSYVKYLELKGGKVPLTGKNWEFKVIEETTPAPFYNVYQTYLNINNGKIPEPEEIEVYPETLKLLEEVKND